MINSLSNINCPHYINFDHKMAIEGDFVPELNEKEEDSFCRLYSFLSE